MLTFAFGSGLAGLAGAFLSQIGNVGPSLGQSYIVDSFMTVVVGGIGSIFGTVISALGIGVTDQSLQQILGNPVLGKILVLAHHPLQWKPVGLCHQERNLEADGPSTAAHRERDPCASRDLSDLRPHCSSLSSCRCSMPRCVDNFTLNLWGKYLSTACSR
jgi:hypothetical protein